MPFAVPERKRLLLVAMSGVRVFDQELLSLGLTLPGFVERSRVIASLPSLGLLTLAAHTPQDWQITYREYDELPGNAAQQIADEGFTVVALSSLTARIAEAYRLCQELRSRGIIVIMGGLHVSALPAEAMMHCDIVVKGEGERVWPQVIADLESGSWQPFYDAAVVGAPSRYHDLQPVPRYDLLDLERYNRLTIQTTRGCPLHCSFCAASRTISPYRKKSVMQIRRELEAILALWPRPFLELADDNSFVDKRWASELVRLLADHPVRWFTESDISLADDPELLRLLGDSGCAQVLIGLESAASESMRGIDTQGWKSRRHRDYAEQVKRIQEHGISVNGCFILGFDQDGPDIFQRTLDYIDSLALAEVQITLLTPFPGTSLRQQLESEDRMLPGASWSQHTLFDLTFQPARISVNEMKTGFRWLMREVFRAARGATPQDFPTMYSPQPIMNDTPSLLQLWLRLLTFRATFEDYQSLNWRHLLAGLAACWLVGMGRYWDDPRATLLQHAGVGSVVYVFVLTAVLWIIVKPLDPQRFSYLGILTMVAMTAPPAALYAIPVEKWMTLEAANHLNLLFLAVVALWRLALWIHYLRTFGWFVRWLVFVSAAMPVGIIFVALMALNLHHVVVDVMGGIRDADKSSQDAAFGAIWLLSLLAVPLSVIASLAWVILVGLSWNDRRKEAAKSAK